MLNNLKAELVRKGLDPVKAIILAIGCSEKTARNKLNGISDITVPEAVKIVYEYFDGEGLSFEYLFTAHKSA